MPITNNFIKPTKHGTKLASQSAQFPPNGIDRTPPPRITKPDLQSNPKPIHTNLRSSTNQTPQTDSILESPDFFQLKNCSPFILELKHNHAERPPAAGDTGGSNFSSLVRVRERQWLARSVAISAAGSSPGAARSATCAGSDSRRQRATVDDGSSARVSVSGQRWRL
ncbi:hypothetical protein Droror1_Dr00026267 [Drosera rotundifolia]